MRDAARSGWRKPGGRRRAADAVVLGTAALLLVLPGLLVAQELGRGPPPDAGTVGTGLALRELDGVGRVLVVGAHPDDEDTSLLTAVARGMGMEAAYLSLTRGEGGQNLIGPELGEGLGIVRTGELLAARELDGARQFFTRAYDFGYSKSAEETFRHWPREEILRDVVEVVRRFRPHVMVSIFSGTPGDGHGQHEVAGIMAREAFEAAADPERFPDAGSPWAPLKLYRRAWRDPGADAIPVETGRFDPLLARSHFQLAMESRSQHRSQDMGTTRPLGSRVSSLIPMESRVPGDGDAGLFAGVDTMLSGLLAGAEASEATRRELDAYGRAVGEARGALAALEPEAAAGALAEAFERIRGARMALPGKERVEVTPPSALRRRQQRTGEALLAALSVVTDVRVDDGLLVPGQEAEVVAELWNGGGSTLENARADLVLPPGWTVREAAAASHGGGGGPGRSPVEGMLRASGPVGRLEPGELARWTFSVRVPEDAGPSRLYYLAEERNGDLYRWPEEGPARELRGLPRDPPLIRGVLETDARLPTGETVEGLRTTRPATVRDVDKALGEVRRPVLVVPALSLSVAPGGLAWPEGSSDGREVTLHLRSEAPGPIEGTVRLEGPDGWRMDPSSAPFRLEEGRRSLDLAVRVTPGAGVEPGEHVFRARADVDGGPTFREGFTLVDYPHIPRAALFEPARLTVSMFPVRVAGGIRVGYVMGSGDDGPEAIRQMGVEVELLDPAAQELDPFDVIVLGIRAYETRPDLVAANERLLRWVEAGGTLVVQYNKYEFPRGGFAPHPLDIHRPHDRVTDPRAPVTLLEPDHPVLSRPNRITAADFDGWVQERGLYFLGEWDERYTPLLAMADPGEEPKRGSLVVTEVGDGHWVYTGLAFFRQLPALVPGAYRLFANLLSLGAEGGR